MDFHCGAGSDGVTCTGCHIPGPKVHTFRRKPLLFALSARNLGVISERVGVERVPVRDEPELRLDVLKRHGTVLLPHITLTAIFQRNLQMENVRIYIRDAAITVDNDVLSSAARFILRASIL